MSLQSNFFPYSVFKYYSFSLSNSCIFLLLLIFQCSSNSGDQTRYSEKYMKQSAAGNYNVNTEVFILLSEEFFFTFIFIILIFIISVYFKHLDYYEIYFYWFFGEIVIFYLIFLWIQLDYTIDVFRKCYFVIYYSD